MACAVSAGGRRDVEVRLAVQTQAVQIPKTRIQGVQIRAVQMMAAACPEVDAYSGEATVERGCLNRYRACPSLRTLVWPVFDECLARIFSAHVFAVRWSLCDGLQCDGLRCDGLRCNAV